MTYAKREWMAVELRTRLIALGAARSDVFVASDSGRRLSENHSYVADCASWRDVVLHGVRELERIGHCWALVLMDDLFPLAAPEFGRMAGETADAGDQSFSMVLFPSTELPEEWLGPRVGVFREIPNDFYCYSSLMPGAWKLSYLREKLESAGQVSPWEFEKLRGTGHVVSDYRYPCVRDGLMNQGRIQVSVLSKLWPHLCWQSRVLALGLVWKRAVACITR